MPGETVHIIIEAVIAALLCAVVIVLVYLGHRMCPPRIPQSDGMGLCWLVAASGAASELERTVSMLTKSASAPCCVIIADCGLEPEARRIAVILERENDSVLLVDPQDLPKLLGDTVWTKQEAQFR